MSIKKTFFVLCFVIAGVSCHGQFVITTNKTTGAIQQIACPSDLHKMNWVFASGDTNLVWQKPEQDWGLGKYNVPGMGVQHEKWTTAVSQSKQGNKSLLLYKKKMHQHSC